MPHSSLLAAAFLSPALFFGGAAAVAAPILIHLLARRRFKRLRWAAMDFLIDAERRNRRRVRMEEWILLALRCLAVVCIAALIARPFFSPAGLSAVWAGPQSSERVFVIDDSLSMAYQLADGEFVFDRAKLAVRRILESIRQETPDDTVTMLRMSQPSSPIDSGTYLDETQADDLLQRLDALSPSQRWVDPAAVVEGAADVLGRNPDVTNAVVYLISDFQRNGWADLETPVGDTPDKASILDPLVQWAGDNRGLRIVLINVCADDAANLAVTEVGLHGGQLVAGTTGKVRAKLANYTDRSVENLELQLTVGNLPQPSKTLRELAPHQSALVDLEAEFLRADYESVRLEIPPDALPADNIRYAAAEVVGAIRILIVNGEPSTDSFDDEVTFLTTALRPEGEVFSGNEVVVVDEAQLDEARLPRFHVVVLANVYRVSEPAIESLERFARQGGGLLVFLGDQVDADLYNLALYRGGEGLLPAELTEVIRASDVSHLVVTDLLHPAVRGLGGERDPLGISQIAFFEFFGCRPFEPTEGELTSPVPLSPIPGEEGENGNAPGRSLPGLGASVSETARRRAARVIARFDDADQSPAIVERRFGLGKVILVTTAVDKEWHQWPDHPTFLPAMMELVQHVTRGGDIGARHLVGDTIDLPLDPAVFEPDVMVRTPAYPNEREVGLTAVAASDGRGLAVSWDHTDSAGLYQFVLRRREGGEVIELVAVNIDPAESDLTTTREGELRQALGDVPFDYVEGIDELTGAVGEIRTELWRVFLLAAAAILMVEQYLAWLWGRRR